MDQVHTINGEGEKKGMILQADNLTKHFGGLIAVNNLSFHVNEGEILGIIGPNGAGKSTVLNMISGVHIPMSGKIVFDGYEITGLKEHEIARKGISRNFQATTLFMNLSVLDNIFVGYHLNYKTNLIKRLFRLPSARKEETILKQRGGQLLQKMGLSAVKNELARNLPHGYQRILGVCIALAANPRILLLDEPMTGMNQNEIETMIQLVRWIRDNGTTIIMIEHNMIAVVNLCDRIIVLDHGVKIAEGSPKEIQQNEQVIEAYLGRE